MSICFLKRTTWLIMIVFIVASFIASIPKHIYAEPEGFNYAVATLSGFGVLGIVMVYLVATYGVAGAGTMVTACMTATSGPFGLLGGVAITALLWKIAGWITAWGLKKLLCAICDKLIDDGWTKEQIKSAINDLPIPSSIAKDIIKLLPFK